MAQSAMAAADNPVGKRSAPGSHAHTQSHTALLRACAYGGVMCASSALNNVFVTYYIDMYTSVSPLSAPAFLLCQCVYMIWNATNDPFFGWIADHSSPRGANGGKPQARRSHAIALGGVLYAAALVFVLSPIATHASMWLRALHFAVALCIYDGALTYTEVNHSALLAEITISDVQRARYNMFAAIGAAIGSGSSFLAYASWRASGHAQAGKGATLEAADAAGGGLLQWRMAIGGMSPFSIFLVCLAAACAFCFQICSRVLRDAEIAVAQRSDRDSAHQANDVQVHAHVVPDGDASAPSHGAAVRRKAHGADSAQWAPVPGAVASAAVAAPVTFLSFLSQVTSRPSFGIYVVVSALQTFDCTFEKNFFVPFMSMLLGSHALHGNADDSFGGLSAMVISLSFLLPHLLTICWTPLIAARGLHMTLASILSVRLGLLGAAFLLGRSTPMRILAFMLCNRVLSESVCRLTPLVVSDLVDEDAALAHRPRELSASVIGTASFAGKVCQSLAPMLAFWLLNMENSGEPSPQHIWQLLLFIPAACVVVQWGSWVFGWKLRGAYLAKIKAQLSALDEDRSEPVDDV